ncbi:SURF1 family protein [Thermopolyspora sp. NPDC052614]|uniref:SURF1 family protein n=1 Tax=Thermopolyspora sp. NPDC052614 TaxID=3155682 RepID=UPI0034469359
MLRTLFAPRLLGLHLLLIGVLVSFTLLGRWQLGVFEESGRPRSADDPAPVAVTTLAPLGPSMAADAVARRVTARGTFDAARQLLVADRTPNAAGPGGRAASGQGYWLLTPLRLDDGTLVAVVRGWVASAGDPATAVPTGTVTVTGRLQPPESTDSVQRGGRLPEGKVATVSTAELINIWTGERLRNGFVIATAPIGGGTPAPRIIVTSPPTVGGAFTWRNLAYAAQWWIFAGFAVFVWYRYVRDAVQGRRGATSPEEAADAATGAALTGASAAGPDAKDDAGPDPVRTGKDGERAAVPGE